MLGRLVGRIDSHSSIRLLTACFEVAGHVEAPDLELHYALCWWSGAPGSQAAQEALITAAGRHPQLRAPAYRIARRRGGVEDWATIARADRYTTWPAVAALRKSGLHQERTIDQLRADGLLRTSGTAARAVWMLRDARVTRIGRSVAIGSYRPGDTEGPHYVPALSSWNCTAALGWADAGPPEELRARIGLVTTQFSFSGYWHWLFEGLLRIVRLDEAGLLATLDRLIVCADDAPLPAVSASLLAAGIDSSSVDFTSKNFDVRVDELVVPIRHHDAGGILEQGAPQEIDDIIAERSRHDNGSEITALRRRLGLDNQVRRGTDRRLLISRHDALKRRVSNESALRAALERDGFETLALGELTFQQQAAVFANAEIVVGPHGAALANLLFATAGTAVVELQRLGGERWLYRGLASTLNLRYASIGCDTDPDAPEDMVVDVGRARSVVLGLLT